MAEKVNPEAVVREIRRKTKVFVEDLDPKGTSEMRVLTLQVV